jgi:hypothetical protein
VYYLTVPIGTLPGEASLDLVLYDSFTLDRVRFDNGDDVLHLYEVEFVE